MGPFPFLRLAPFVTSFDNPSPSRPSSRPSASSSATGYSLTRYRVTCTSTSDGGSEMDPGDGWPRLRGLRVS